MSPIDQMIRDFEKTGFNDSKCRRINLEPFRSGNKINTIKSTFRHPTSDKLCFTFLEDDSIYEYNQIIILK